jgi:drug/metabolite transporter (DMT)-like permease
MIAVIGGLGAACAWAISTLCSSRSSRIIGPLSVVAWIMLVGIVITAPIAAATGVPSGLDGSAGAWLLVSGAGNVAGMVLAYAALRVGQVAMVAPLVSTEGAVAALIAVLAGEPLTAAVAVTLVVIVCGIGLTARPGSAERSVTVARSVHSKSVLLAIGAATLFGASLYATGRAGDELPAAWVVLSARLIGTVAVAVPLALLGRLRLARSAVPLVVTSGICEVLGFYAFTAGARHGIAVAAVLSSQFAVLAALAGYLLFHERLSRTQLTGVATVVAGVAVLSALQA